MKAKIYYDVEVKEHPEFGRVMTFTCPDCGVQLVYMEGMSSGNVTKCNCEEKEWSFFYDVHITAREKT